MRRAEAGKAKGRGQKAEKVKKERKTEVAKVKTVSKGRGQKVESKGVQEEDRE